MEQKLRLGILGVGNMGTVHVRNLEAGKCPEIELTAVADIDPNRLAWIKENVNRDIALYATAEELIESGKIDALLVAVPHYDHPKYAIMAMEHGLHVIIEKPAGVYTKQVREMIAVADRHDVTFGIMMNQRTNTEMRKLKEIVDSGVMGDIRRTNWIITNWYRPQAYYDSGNWRATWSGEGGGVLLNQCPHQLDLWQWICGMPSKITAHLSFGKWHDIEVEDDVTAFAEYPNGATGTFITTTGDYPGSNRFEIDFDRGKIVVEEGRVTEWLSDQSEAAFSAANKIPFNAPHLEKHEIELDGINPEHSGVLNAFADHILHGGKLVADGREGINGLTISNAMHLSAWLGKTIELPFDEDLYYEELMKRVKTSRRKETVSVFVEDMTGTFGKK